MRQKVHHVKFQLLWITRTNFIILTLSVLENEEKVESERERERVNNQAMRWRERKV